MRTAIKHNQYYGCIVLQENKPFQEYSFIIACYEDDIGTRLYIYSKDEIRFLNVVLTKLKKLIDIFVYV